MRRCGVAWPAKEVASRRRTEWQRLPTVQLRCHVFIYNAYPTKRRSMTVESSHRGRAQTRTKRTESDLARTKFLLPSISSFSSRTSDRVSPWRHLSERTGTFCPHARHIGTSSGYFSATLANTPYRRQLATYGSNFSLCENRFWWEFPFMDNFFWSATYLVMLANFTYSLKRNPWA